MKKMEEETPEPPNGEYVRKVDGKVLKNNKIEITYYENPEDFKPDDKVLIMRGEDYLWFANELTKRIENLAKILQNIKIYCMCK